MATASDPFVAAERMRVEVPDVIVLDVEMPRMDGITFLRKLMSQRPIPVIMCSSLTEKGAETTLKALEYGAVDVITKPRLGTDEFLRESREHLIATVKAAAVARVRRLVPIAHGRAEIDGGCGDRARARQRGHGSDHRKSGAGRRLHRAAPKRCACCSNNCRRMRPES